MFVAQQQPHQQQQVRHFLCLFAVVLRLQREWGREMWKGKGNANIAVSLCIDCEFQLNMFINSYLCIWLAWLTINIMA